MKPIVALGIAALLLLQATGLDAVLAPEPCASACPTDEPDGSCGPQCSDCLCCPALRSCVQPDSIASSPVFSTMAPRPEQEPLPAKADPAEIFHVPKPPLI